MKKTDIAWAAGFFDGEGCITVFRANGGRNHALRVGFAQKNKIPVERFEDLFGGEAIYHMKKDGSGHWYWNLYGRNALRFLQTISPYLVMKADQASTAIAFQLRRQTSTTKNPLTSEERALDLQDYIDLKRMKQAVE
jgi:hypothetical protein